ncbi:MAG: hypothetical protein KAR13_12325 [Desulfobulbaceae bacterium]|nr:hypothetical protein [Desulfobulbaceae bacterium]
MKVKLAYRKIIGKETQEAILDELEKIDLTKYGLGSGGFALTFPFGQGNL